MSDSNGLMQPLRRGIEALGLAVDTTATERLLGYLALMARWNRVFNLTAVRDPQQMLAQHLLDSLTVAPYIEGERILDVGSGPGLPGIPLAIIRTDRDFTLLDSNGKKTRFMRQAVIELGLSNVEVVHGRVENYHPPEGFDTVISRAFAALADYVRLAGPHCRQDGRLLAMKGRYPADELDALPGDFRVVAVHRLHVPGLEAERHLVEIRRDPNRA